MTRDYYIVGKPIATEETAGFMSTKSRNLTSKMIMDEAFPGVEPTTRVFLTLTAATQYAQSCTVHGHPKAGTVPHYAPVMTVKMEEMVGQFFSEHIHIKRQASSRSTYSYQSLLEDIPEEVMISYLKVDFSKIKSFEPVRFEINGQWITYTRENKKDSSCTLS